MLLLVTLVLIGSSIRIYQRRSITNRLEVWNRQSIEQDSLARIKTEYESSLPININLADENLLQQLPGIGPALAGRIIEWRKNNGLFRSVDDLEKVSGIGVVLREKLRGRIVVNTADAMGK